MYIIEKNKLIQTLIDWSAKFDVFAPQQVENYSQYQRINPNKKLILSDIHNTRFPPKAFFLPQSEVMLKYNAKLNKLEDYIPELKQRIIFGVRPCDAKAITLLDTVFSTEQNEDPYWSIKRESTIIIGMGCVDPCQTCFCSTVGGGPFNHDGLDALITEVDGLLFVEVLKEKSIHLFSSFSKATKEQEKKVLSIQKNTESSMKKAFETEGLKQNLDKMFESEYWARISESCLGCGVCTFLCPTCFCFDIVDEVYRNERVRNWDTCMFRIYSQEASGHNPRPSRKERTRQRLMHKFSYWLDHVGEIGCTGCGRCVRYCPVGLDIRAMLRTAYEVESEVVNV